MDIPHAMHASLQSAKGALIRAVRDECGGVLIRFPSATSNSDKILLKGPAEDVELAKRLLLDLANDTVMDVCFILLPLAAVFHMILVQSVSVWVLHLHLPRKRTLRISGTDFYVYNVFPATQLPVLEHQLTSFFLQPQSDSWQCGLHCVPHCLATLSHVHVDESATGLFPSPHCKHGTGCRRS